MSIGSPEIKTQEKVIEFFKAPNILGYQYLGNLKEVQNRNIKEDRLRQYLCLKNYSDKLISGAIQQLQQAAGNLSHGIYDANKQVYSLLKYGAKVNETPEEPPKTVKPEGMVNFRSPATQVIFLRSSKKLSATVKPWTGRPSSPSSIRKPAL